MRSLAATFVLAITAAIACAVAGWQLQQGNFDSVFGAPPTPVGSRIYASFKAADVRHIRISSSGTTATFALQENGWQASAPWADRMDPRAAVGIINFTLGMRVEDLAGVDEINPAKAGLKESAVNIRLEDANHTPIANYKLGRVTPWKAEVEGMEQPVPTVFVQPRDKNRKRHIYACTGDISPLFKDGLKFLRDHRPFYFNPVTLQKIRIRSQQGDLTLGRATPTSAWRIVKPLDFPTDPKAMKTLLEGIFELQAAKVSDRADVTLPPSDSAVKTGQIAIVPFGSETETLLEILPPETPEAKDVKATVSNRPATIFDLPLKPEPGLISLANLPLSVNELRDPTLTHLNIQSLRGISIQPATGAEIIISRNPPQPWMASVGEKSFEANEENLYSLLKAVTTSRATGFESDAATDFTPWGLHRPFLTLRFLAESDEVLELRFGIDGKGGYFVNRLGTATVMRVDQALVSTIAVRPYEWRQSRLWSLDRTNLFVIERQQTGEASLVLGYSDALESWTAKSDDKNLSDTLDPARANFMLSELEGLKVSRWLATDDEAALGAFANPSLVFKVSEKIYDDDQKLTGLKERTLTIAPASANANPGFYYGRMNLEPHPFMLSREVYQKLAVDLFGK
jgi:hypothetical protein